MKPEPENVSGKKVETHEFSHSVEHRVNWSHVLGAIVLILVVYKLAPILAEQADNEEKRR